MSSYVLVVDDQVRNIERLNEALSVQPFNYVFVNEVNAALYVLYEYDVNHDVALVVCNVNLEQSDVHAFIERLKGDERLSSLPILCYCVTNNLGLESIRVVAEAFDADEFIATTTFDAELICREIRRSMSSHHFMPPGEYYGSFDDFANPPVN